MRLDLADEQSIAHAAAAIEAELGRLDVLVNNAGIALGFEPPGKRSLSTMRNVFETNVVGTVAVTDAMLPMLRRASAARIVNVSSEVGSIASISDPGSPLWQIGSLPYPESKAALNLVTAQYAKVLIDTPIKVNAANPGYCATDLNRNSGFRTAEQGAQVCVHLATLGEDGPSGVLWGHLWTKDGPEAYGVLPW